MFGHGVRAAIVPLWWLVLVLLMGAVAQAVTLPPGTSDYHYFTSTVDDSRQFYGIYVPTSYSNFAKHPVAFIGHGFKGSATTNFDGLTGFADANGWLLVQHHGRGNSFYDGIGETDLFEVLADLRARGYTLDDDRLYYEGASMGGTGAYRFGVRFPHIFAAVGGCDGFADYRAWYEQYYGPANNPTEVAECRVPNLLMASCVDTAERAKWQHTWMTVDQADAGVWPENGNNLYYKLDALGAATTAERDDYAYVYDPVPGGYHCYGYDQLAMYKYFAGIANNRYPSHVLITTNRLKYGEQYWARIDRLQTANVFARLEIEATAGSDGVTVNADNVLAFTLTLDGNVIGTNTAATITVVGYAPVTINPLPADGKVTLYAQRGTTGTITGWGTEDQDAALLWKRAGLEGPIGDAYTSRFVVCFGSAGTSAESTANLTEAQAFCDKWNTWMIPTCADTKTKPIQIAPIDEKALTDAQIAEGNIILFGTIESSALLQAVQAQYPVKVHQGSVSVGSKTYTGTNYGAYVVYPNPKNASKYLVVSHGTIRVPKVTTDAWVGDPAAEAKDLEALPWYWPDYVVFDTNIVPRATVQSKLAYLPDAFVNAGYFDVNWQLPAEPPAAPRPDLMVKTGTGAYVGDNIYTGTQSVTQQAQTGTATYTVAVQNDGTAEATFVLKATGSGNGLTATYTDASGTDRTEALTSSAGWAVTLAPGASQAITVTLALDANAAVGTTGTATVTASAGGMTDAASMVVKKIAPPLSIGTFTASPASPALVGSPVTLTANTTGGTDVQYQFRVGVVGKRSTNWTTVRAWGSTNTCTWTPTTAGTYTLEVSIREGNTGTPTGRQITNYVVKAKLSGVSLSVSPSRVSLGGTVNLTATATGGAQVEYQFLYKPSASTVYTPIGGWTTNRVCPWKPAARGSYTLMVYAREVGSTTAFDVKSSTVSLSVR